MEGSDEVLDEALELAEVAALVDAVAELRVVLDDGVAAPPVRAGLGVEPVDAPGPVRDLLQHPALGRVVVGTGVSEHEDARLRADLAAPALPEDREGVPVVRV